MVIIYPKGWDMGIDPYRYFLEPSSTAQKRYEALRAFFLEKKTAEEVAERFGYTVSSFYSLTRDFRDFIRNSGSREDMFFMTRSPGRKEKDSQGTITGLIVSLRKKHLSVPEIKAITDSHGYRVSERYIHHIIKKEGFVRLPRRSHQDRGIDTDEGDTGS